MMLLDEFEDIMRCTGISKAKALNNIITKISKAHVGTTQKRDLDQIYFLLQNFSQITDTHSWFIAGNWEQALETSLKNSDFLPLLNAIKEDMPKR